MNEEEEWKDGRMGGWKGERGRLSAMLGTLPGT